MFCYRRTANFNLFGGLLPDLAARIGILYSNAPQQGQGISLTAVVLHLAGCCQRLFTHLQSSRPIPKQQVQQPQTVLRLSNAFRLALFNPKLESLFEGRTRTLEIAGIGQDRTCILTGVALPLAVAGFDANLPRALVAFPGPVVLAHGDQDLGHILQVNPFAIAVAGFAMDGQRLFIIADRGLVFSLVHGSHAQVVQHHGLAAPISQFTTDRDGLLIVVHRGRVISAVSGDDAQAI